MEIKQNEQDRLFINGPISQGNIWNDLHRSMSASTSCIKFKLTFVFCRFNAQQIQLKLRF